MLCIGQEVFQNNAIMQYGGLGIILTLLLCFTWIYMDFKYINERKTTLLSAAWFLILCLIFGSLIPISAKNEGLALLAAVFTVCGCSLMLYRILQQYETRNYFTSLTIITAIVFTQLLPAIYTGTYVTRQGFEDITIMQTIGYGFQYLNLNYFDYILNGICMAYIVWFYFGKKFR